MQSGVLKKNDGYISKQVLKLEAIVDANHRDNRQQDEGHGLSIYKRRDTRDVVQKKENAASAI